ncbi:tripartite motif-containing protein 35-like [Astatotilapia calliptera]|uniref:Zinc-binding protein A33-like n=1 Tax=Astatotilapia calliptera TaxID=8154 RepID=A0A3P8NT68_ASTCA|nr:tripartite motif-containing protein 35-like [Astatotilapia calliptera]
MQLIVFVFLKGETETDASFTGKMSLRSEEDFLCPVCQEVFTDPVVLSCSHSFCKDCLQKWWSGKKTCDCPCCKRRSSKSDPPRNLALKNLCEAFLAERGERGERGRRVSEGSESLCSLHSEKFKIFCLDHQQPICVICRDSKMHSNHRFRPIDEAAQDLKEELQKSLKPLKEKLQVFEDVKGSYDQIVKHIKVQAQSTEGEIKEQFKNLHQFLHDEEKVRIANLKEDEVQKSKIMKEKVESLSREIAALSSTIRATERELKAEDISFLQNYKAAVKKAQQHPLLQDPELASGVLIDVAKHLGNLTFNVWNKMKEKVFYSPVILDPNTADPELVVFDNLSSVKSGERKPLPKNPERTKFSCSVLGSKGFNSGTHEWDVDVGNNKDWELGVLSEYSQVSGRLQSGLWRILFSNGKFSAFSSPDTEKDLPVKKEVRRIRVHLDFDRGKLSFSDLDTNAHMHTFTHSFSDTLFPYIYTENPQPVKILPVKVTVTVEKNT